MNYSVNVESLQRNFPEGWDVPPLLLEFADRLEGIGAGTIGYFDLQSERFNDYWIENGADLHPYFAFFLCDPTGGQVGFWLYDGLATVSPPIVLVGSQGELQILADTLEQFFARLAKGETGVPDLDDREDRDRESTELFQWLESRGGQSPGPQSVAHPDLAEWLERWGDQQCAAIDNDSRHLQIADKLRKYRKPDAKAYETNCFDVLLVGSQFKMWRRSYGPQPMAPDEVADLEPLFRSLREERARKVPERGLWFYSWVKVGATGGATLCCDFMKEPDLDNQTPLISASDYAIDLKAFPRSQHWYPDWLRSK